MMVGFGAGLRSIGLMSAADILTVAAIIPAIAFMLLVGRAVQRGRAIGYWRRSRELEFELERAIAYRDLVRDTLRAVGRLDTDAASNVLEVLGCFATGARDVLSETHDDVAVVVAIESGRSFRILQSALGRASPWTELAPGKSCQRNGSTFEETAARHAPYSQTQRVAVKGGDLLLAVLSNTEFTDRDRALLTDVPFVLSLITARLEQDWQDSGLDEQRTLRAIV
jgi:hypothetical protein